MYSITKKYTDFKGKEREEEFLFNLTKAEIANIELSTGGFVEYVNNILKKEDRPALIKLIKDVIGDSYGVVSDDGRRFIKTPELRAEFEQTEAYSEIYMDFIQHKDKFDAFIEGILPNVEEAPKTLEPIIEELTTNN